MVLSKIVRLVGLGVLVGQLDSVLCEYHYEQFSVSFFISFDDICRALRFRVCCPFSWVLEAQPVYLSATIRGVGPVIHLRTMRCSEQTDGLMSRWHLEGANWVTMSVGSIDSGSPSIQRTGRATAVYRLEGEFFQAQP